MSLITDISKELCRALVESLDRHKDRINLDPAPDYVGIAALGYALAVQCVCAGVSEKTALSAFLRSMRSVEASLDKGEGTLTIAEVDLTPKAKA